jgi:hypothetical protein
MRRSSVPEKTSLELGEQRQRRRSVETSTSSTAEDQPSLNSLLRRGRRVSLEHMFSRNLASDEGAPQQQPQTRLPSFFTEDLLLPGADNERLPSLASLGNYSQSTTMSGSLVGDDSTATLLSAAFETSQRLQDSNAWLGNVTEGEVLESPPLPDRDSTTSPGSATARSRSSRQLPPPGRRPPTEGSQ